MHYADVDIAWDEDEERLTSSEIADQIKRENNLHSVTVLEERGPGAGWPVMRLTGEMADVISAVHSLGFIAELMDGTIEIKEVS